jgi:hypothetical protein
MDRKEPSLQARAVYLALKSKCRELVGLFGSQENAATPTRVEQTDISDYCSPNRLWRFMPVDVVMDLESIVGTPLVTAMLAANINHALVPLPLIAAQRTPLGRVTAQAMKETSEVFARLGGFLDDGVLDSAEGAQLDREIDEAILKLLALKAEADAVVARGGVE